MWIWLSIFPTLLFLYYLHELFHFIIHWHSISFLFWQGLFCYNYLLSLQFKWGCCQLDRAVKQHKWILQCWRVFWKYRKPLAISVFRRVLVLQRHTASHRLGADGALMFPKLQRCLTLLLHLKTHLIWKIRNIKEHVILSHKITWAKCTQPFKNGIPLHSYKGKEKLITGVGTDRKCTFFWWAEHLLSQLT